MSELNDLLPVPAERDLPAGRLEQRAAALVAAVESDLAGAAARRGRLRVLRSWLMAVSLFLATTLAVVCSVLFAGGSRENTTRIAAGTAVVLAGGSGLAALAVAPRPPRLAH